MLSNTALVSLIQAKNYLRVDAAASLHIDAEYVGIGTEGGAVEFSLPSGETPISGSLVLKVNNVLQVEDSDFTIAAEVITFEEDSVPADGHIITASYDYEAGTNTFESYDDDLLETLIEAATKKAEDHCGRAFVRRTITEMHIGDGSQMLKLYKQPVVDVTSVSVGGVALTSWSERLSIGRIYHLVVWPLDYEIEVVYQAGYGADRDAAQLLVPDAVAAVLLIVADLYENRGDKVDSINITGIGSMSYKLPSRAEELLNPMRTNLV